MSEDLNEKGYTKLVAISKSTKELIDGALTQEILKHHPELINMRMTYNYKIRRAVETYLKI